MSGVHHEGLLTQQQLALLDELAAAVGTASSSDAKPVEADDLYEPGGAAYEAFYRRWQHVKVQHRALEEHERRSRWRWIDQVQDICSTACRELEALLAHLAELDEQRQEVVRKTTALHEQCEQMVQDQEQLSSATEALAQRLDIFDCVADVARVLDQGNASTSHTEFSSVLDQLDASIGFLEMHPDFCQAQDRLSQFEHLRNRACIAIKFALQKSFESSVSQVERQLRERDRDDVADTQVFYTRFRAAAQNYRPLLIQLHRRIDVHEDYLNTLCEVEASYVQLRLRLVTNPVSTQLQTVLHQDLEMSQLAPATRQASTYIIDLSQYEKQCFEAYFEIRQSQEALRSLLELVADIFYKSVRPVVLKNESIDSLREMADCLQLDILQPHQQSSNSDMTPVLAAVFRLHKDVQEKLIYRVQTYIRDEIKGYQVTSRDLNYPAILYSDDLDVSAEQDNEAVGTQRAKQRGWFPTMRRTLSILDKIYRVLELSTFQGLAQEAVDLCIASLRHASTLLAQRPAPTHAFGALVQMMDSQLFLVKHLLLLREHVASFECDLVVNEKYFNFGNVWEAMQMKLPDGFLGIFKPKMSQTSVDSKKDIEAELKAACEMLITNLTADITRPLASFNNQIGDFIAKAGGDRTKLKDQPFMALSQLREIISAFLNNVRERVPFAAAHIRLYLTATGSVGGDQSTASILFKPVQIRLIDTWGRLEGLLEEQQLAATELDGLGFIRPDALREQVSALFSTVMEMPWEQLAESIEQVPRPATPSGALPAVPAQTVQQFLEPEAPSTLVVPPLAREEAATLDASPSAVAVSPPPPAQDPPGVVGISDEQRYQQAMAQMALVQEDAMAGGPDQQETIGDHASAPVAVAAPAKAATPVDVSPTPSPEAEAPIPQLASKAVVAPVAPPAPTQAAVAEDTPTPTKPSSAPTPAAVRQAVAVPSAPPKAVASVPVTAEATALPKPSPAALPPAAAPSTLPKAADPPPAAVSAAPSEASAGEFGKGDTVSVSGRLGVVIWDGRPAHKFVKVKWSDDGSTSATLGIAKCTKHIA